jgi:hypothetical protein
MCKRVRSIGAVGLLDAIVNNKKTRGLGVWWSSSKGCWIFAGHTEYGNNTVRIPAESGANDPFVTFGSFGSPPPKIRDTRQFLLSQAYPHACATCSKSLLEVSS